MIAGVVYKHLFALTSPFKVVEDLYNNGSLNKSSGNKLVGKNKSDDNSRSRSPSKMSLTQKIKDKNNIASKYPLKNTIK